jgi:CheY-like chemotaxis protein
MVNAVAPLKALQQVLLVEDNPDEERLALRALRSTGIPLEIVVLRDGHEALRHIENLETDAAAKNPALVLLDLKLPKIGGIEVLRRFREIASLKHIPVVVCSSSDEESDVASSMALGATEYLRKSVDYAEFSDSIRRVADAWLRP